MITTIRRGEIYHFARMDPAVLDEVRDIEWAAQQRADLPSAGREQAPDSGLVEAIRRLLSRRAAH